MSDGVIVKPEPIPQQAWDQSGPAARAAGVTGRSLIVPPSSSPIRTPPRLITAL